MACFVLVLLDSVTDGLGDCIIEPDPELQGVTGQKAYDVQPTLGHSIRDTGIARFACAEMVGRPVIAHRNGEQSYILQCPDVFLRRRPHNGSLAPDGLLVCFSGRVDALFGFEVGPRLGGVDEQANRQLVWHNAEIPHV